MKREKENESRAVLTVANLMAASIRTAPKGRGVDRISVRILINEEIEKIANMMEKKGEKKSKKFFRRDANSIRDSLAIILIGVKGTMPKKPEDPINCGACGFGSCQEFIKAKKKKGEDFVGPLCLFEVLDLGIALGSAVKLASELNIDNRIMYTVGAAAKELDLISADVIIGIPLNVSGKNIFFDRK